MKQSATFIALLSAILCVVGTTAFAPKATVPRAHVVENRRVAKTTLNLFGEEGEPRKKLTRDSEPEEFFST